MEEVNFNQKERTKLSKFVLYYKNGEFFKDIFMPLVFKQCHKEFVQFASGLVSNLNIGQNKYQNIVRNQLGKELQATLGVNNMVPKNSMSEEIKEQKESLQESLSLKFVQFSGVIAAYTDVKKTKLILYHYIDAFPWMHWRQFFSGETAIRLKVIEPHNLLSCIVTICS